MRTPFDAIREPMGGRAKPVNLRALRFAFSFAGAFLVSGCAVPVPADLNSVEATLPAVTPVAPNESIAITSVALQAGQNDQWTSCITDAFQSHEPPIRLITPSEFHSTVLAHLESATLPRRRGAGERALAQPAIQSSVMRLNLRYAIQISGSSHESEDYLVLWPAFSVHRHVNLQAAIWDLKEACYLGDIVAVVSGDGFVTFVPFVLVLSVAPMTTSKACDVLGERLVTLLTTGRIPEVDEWLLDEANLREQARLGSKPAFLELARKHSDLSYLRTHAENGDYEAALILATEFEEPQLLDAQGDWNLNRVSGKQAWTWYLIIKENYPLGHEHLAFKLLCHRADLDVTYAQRFLAEWHVEKSWEPPVTPLYEWARRAGVGPDNRIAYLWWTRASQTRPDLASDYLSVRDLLSKAMTPEAIDQAEFLVQNWQPGQCENRLH